jgi:hypothetical protein
MAQDDPDINKILANVAVLGIEKASSRTLKYIQKVWLGSTSKVGFTPEPEEASRMKDISVNSTYQRFKLIVGKYKFTAYIKVGLLIYDLNQKGDRERVQKIRDDVYNSKDGANALKIIHIASTGVLLHVLEYLVNSKDEKNLSQFAVRRSSKKY